MKCHMQEKHDSGLSRYIEISSKHSHSILHVSVPSAPAKCKTCGKAPDVPKLHHAVAVTWCQVWMITWGTPRNPWGFQKMGDLADLPQPLGVSTYETGQKNVMTWGYPILGNIRFHLY